MCFQSGASGRFFRFFRPWRGRRGTARDNRVSTGTGKGARPGPERISCRGFRKIAGIYVPSFFEISLQRRRYNIRRCSAVFRLYRGQEKSLSRNLDESCPIPEKPLVPIIDIVHNRLGLEIARGCTRGCRFCQASFIYRPVRERNPLYVSRRQKRRWRQAASRMSRLLSFSTGDYCRIQDLLGALVQEFEPRKIAVSFPSMRVGTLTRELMEHIKKIRKTGFTLAPEAGSERLRRVINKGIRDEDLLRPRNRHSIWAGGS